MSVEEDRSADLHIHSTASDGRLTPAEIVALAVEKGFACIALADHDSVGGVEEALAAAAAAGLEVIPAVELSTLYRGGEVHILGYFVDWRDKELLEALDRILAAREGRARGMVERLQKMGVDVGWDEVRQKAGSAFVGRPHVAKVLLEKGYIGRFEDAFTDRFIGKGGPAYVERYEISPEEGIGLVRQSGGVAVLAHPGFFKKGGRLDEADVRGFMEHGLQGLEVYHTKHTGTDTAYYLELAEKYGLAVTGGADCHGGNTGEVLLGRVRLDYRHVAALRDLWAATGDSRRQLSDS